MTKIAILGAAGAMAEVVRRDLSEFSPATEVTLVDLREIAAKYSNERAATADVRDEAATARLLAGHDAVLNCVTYYWNLPVMRAALAARVPYSDLGGLYHGTQKQFDLHEEFVAAGVPALLGMGSTPGITNAMAGFLARELDRVHEAHVRVGCLDRGASGALPIPYALDTVLDEFALEPFVVEQGQAHPVAPRSGEEEIDFPPPVGRMRAIYTLHSEVAMFARSFPGLSGASFKVAFEPAFMEKVRFLVELGFAGRAPRVGGVSPRQMLLALGADQAPPSGGVGEPDDCDCLRVDLAGEIDGRPVRRRGESIIGPHRAWGFGAGALDTGVPLAIAGQLLAERAVATPGVLCPERALPFERFFDELAKRGIQVAFSEQGQLDD
jgi:lysine 6-dehydrogenase